MAQTSIRVRTVQEACVAMGWAGHRTLTVDRPEQAGGMGLGFNGAELLLLAIGGCYSNDIFREAAKRGMVIYCVVVFGDALFCQVLEEAIRCKYCLSNFCDIQTTSCSLTYPFMAASGIIRIARLFFMIAWLSG